MQLQRMQTQLDAARQRCRGRGRATLRLRVSARTVTTAKPAKATTAGTAVSTRLQVGTTSSKAALVQAEKQLLRELQGAKGRALEGEALDRLTAAVEVLEANGGVPGPTNDPELNGLWRLLFTSRPGTASPIQRAFVGVESFSVFQEVDLASAEARVNNIVRFGDIGQLKVEAQASTEGRPLEGFTPRKDTGEFLFGLFGRSFTYAPARPNSRVDFQFDQAAFTFSFLPFSIPYPVPFKLLGDERKGWIDTTYLSQDRSFRLSRGNKGTLFVLQRDVPIKARLRKAIQDKDDEQVEALLEELQAANPTRAPARSPLASGRWRLVWSQQAPTASALQKWGSKQSNSFQIIDAEAGTLINLVDLGAVRVVAEATCEAASDTRTNVYISKTSSKLGPLTVPLPGPNDRKRAEDGAQTGFVDWLYLDEDLRVTRGSKGSVFIHFKEAQEEAE